MPSVFETKDGLTDKSAVQPALVAEDTMPKKNNKINNLASFIVFNQFGKFLKVF